MASRYVVGPLSLSQAQRSWNEARREGSCRAFNAEGNLDLTLNAEASWDALCAQLPQDWRPEFLVLWLPYTVIPEGLWSVPVPIIGLAPDWNLLWHAYRYVAPRCDLVLTDNPGVEIMQQAGWDHVRAANLFGLEQASWNKPDLHAPRDLDVVFAGNFHPAVQGERLAWLGRLAALGSQWRICLATSVFGEDYKALLRRARIVFNRSIRGECNLRAFEAVAAGALLFQEEGNREVSAYFRDGQEAVYYNDDNFEELLHYYLSHEDERLRLASAATERFPAFTWECLWGQALSTIQEAWPLLLERSQKRTAPDSNTILLGRTWQMLGGGGAADTRLASDLGRAVIEQPQHAHLHNALGLVQALVDQSGGLLTASLAQRAAGYFQRAVAADSNHVLAALNLVEALVGIEQTAVAVDGARRILQVLDRQPIGNADAWNGGHFPLAFDHFRVEWEKASWQHAGQPRAEFRAKQTLLRWRLHALLADLTGDLVHYQEAALARPDLPMTRAALGCALARGKRPAEAVNHLRQAVTANPFDLSAARALFQALGEVGDTAGQRNFAQERRLLAQAAGPLVPEELWFTQCAPVGTERASLLILCCNQLEFTRLCLESVLQHTRSPYELILVDNGSSDGTPTYLEEMKTRPGPERVVVIRNEENRGFPAGCNQALAEAEGQYLVFLNNDTVVTAGWLEGMVAWALHDWPKVGLVGAVTNYSRPPQQIPVPYSRVEDLASFAASRQRQYAGKAQRADRLTGFCLLTRRDVLEKVGDLDERYGLGFFDDDDFSIRVAQAGFDRLVALNVYIHHFGSRTFTGLGVNCHAQLADNLERFKEKWGAEAASGYRLPQPNGTVAQARPPANVESEARPVAFVPAHGAPAILNGLRPRVSLCLIVKNEEDNLPACLGSVADLVDETIVVDTGSTDNTRAVAERYGARVVDFPWVDSFAAARNEGLRHATGDWIFWMDADDRLDEENRQKLRELFANLQNENVAYSMKCLCLPDPINRTSTLVDHMRLFRNQPELRWKYRVHEQILPAIRSVSGQVRFADVVIRHAGYQDPSLRRRKLERDLRLLDMEDREHPDDAFTLFNLGCIYQELGKPADALPVLKRSLQVSHPADSIVRKLYALIVGCYRALGLVAEALTMCQEGRCLYPEDTELLFVEGVLRLHQKDLAGAEACLVRVQEPTANNHFASVDAGLRTYKAWHNLGVVYKHQGRLAEAAGLWERVLAERPDFLQAWIGLSELYSQQGAWDDLEKLAKRLEQEYPQGVAEAALMRARGLLAREDYQAARSFLEALMDKDPEALMPRILYSHAWLKEGKDLLSAEYALRTILARDPGNREARHNLTLLLQSQGRKMEGAGVDGVTLADLYQQACSKPSDINEHLPTLFALAKECRHITEFGTRTGISTTAFLYAQPEKLVCYDLRKYAEVYHLEILAGRTKFLFHLANVLRVTIEETDLLFIDSWHVYEQLKEELRLHGAKARMYIVLHDTTTFGTNGEGEGRRGLWPAIEEFLAEGHFTIKDRYENNNGLTVLERKPITEEAPLSEASP